MIKKLYNLKKNQTEQKLIQKSLFESKIEQIDAEILLTKNRIDTASVEKFGAISDFMILTIHKNTMKMHIQKLNVEKNGIYLQIENIIKVKKQNNDKIIYFFFIKNLHFYKKRGVVNTSPFLLSVLLITFSFPLSNNLSAL